VRPARKALERGPSSRRVARPGWSPTRADPPEAPNRRQKRFQTLERTLGIKTDLSLGNFHSDASLPGQTHLRHVSIPMNNRNLVGYLRHLNATRVNQAAGL
jgi:hypothetical protein